MITFIVMLLALGCGAVWEQRNRELIFKLIAEEQLDFIKQVQHDFDFDQFMRKRMKSVNFVLLNALWLPFSKNKIRSAVIFMFFVILVYKIPYLKEKKKVQKMVDELKMRFPIWLREVQVLLEMNTVVVSLKKSKQEAPQLMRKELEALIEKLESEPCCYRHYADFLSGYSIVEVSRAMKYLYRCSIEGKGDSYRNLDQLSYSASKWIRSQRKEHREMRLSVYQWWGMLPLIAVTVMFLVIMGNVINDLMRKGVMM